jgi:hypothetical protein
MAAAPSNSTALARLARHNELHGTNITKLGECNVCHKEVHHYSFHCKKHSLESRRKDGWFGENRKKNWGNKRLKMKPRAAKAMHAQARATREENLLKSGQVLSPGTTTILYDNYKEPLKKVEDGFGFYGTVALDESRNHVQCHICGNLYTNLSVHLPFHKIKTVDYKDKFGLAPKTVLAGEAYRERLVKLREVRVKEGADKGLPEHLKRYYDEVERETGKRGVRVGTKKRHWTLEEQNKAGLCPDQVLEKLTDYIKELGRVPTQDEFKRHYHTRYMSSMRYHFGNWHDYVTAAGYESVKKALESSTTPDQLITYLKEFYEEHKRVPMNSDFKRGIVVGRYHYYKHFGTLNNARVEAGIPAVIPLAGHKYMLIQPEEYMEYLGMKDTITDKRRRNKEYADFYKKQQIYPVPAA